MYALTTIHSTGVNWGQALATWVPVVLAVAGTVAAAFRAFRKMQDNRQARFEKLIATAIKTFGDAIGVKMTQQENHLNTQDKRFDRIDRALDIDTE